MSFVAASNSNPLSYAITKSLRFRRSASANLTRTPAGSSNQSLWTWSGWVKRGQLGATQTLFSAYAFASVDYQTYFGFTSDDKFQFYNVWGGASSLQNLITTQVFRDPSSWYHIVIAVDMSQATYQLAIKIYINGLQITAFGTTSFTNANQTTAVNSAQPHAIGVYATQNTNYFDGYLAEVNFINGSQLLPSSFGSANALTGVWQPARYAGTYGTNGFYLPFTDNSTAAALGTDFSGNSNTWTVNNISITAGVTYDSMTDVPTITSSTVANFCTLNPVYVSNIKAAPTLSNANLTINAFYDRFMNGTISLPRSGKFYWEATVTAATTGGNQTALGINTNQGDNRAQYSFVSTLNDVWGVAVNVDSFSISWYKNNVLQSTGGISSTLEYFPFFYTDTNISPTHQWAANFGQRPFTYTPPSGFKALNTFNLPDSTIPKGNKLMDATLYTGNGSTQSIVNAAGFRPDFVWTKSRSTGSTNHLLTNSVTGNGVNLYSNLTNAESTRGCTFTSTGFSYTYPAEGGDGNVSGQTYVGWQWNAGGAAVTNTAGSISAQVSANPTAGFSVVTYTGTGANATVGHGLGVAPKMIIVKQRNGTFTWRVYHSSLANTQVLYLSATDGVTTETTAWNSTTPTSSVFSVGTGSGTNGSTNTYVAYCWSEIDGFSKFGSYTGNNSADGTFVYLGFRPAFVMIKGTDVVSDWVIKDYQRANNYNPQTGNLYADLNLAEDTTASVNVDFLSNGFKLRGTYSGTNGPYNYMYMAFAENPFKQSLAR
jgi:hypothetical protein